MKDYIYLDEEFLNSVLAQYEEGLISSFSKESGSAGVRQESSETMTEGGIDGIVSIGAKYIKGVKEQSGTELTESQSRTIDYVLKDYGVDILLDKLDDYEKKKNSIQDADEGDFVVLSSSFQIYDFNLIANISAQKNMSVFKKEPTEINQSELKEIRNKLRVMRSKGKLTLEQKNEIVKLEKQIHIAENGGFDDKNFNIINKASSFANEIFDNDIIICGEKLLMICKRSNFRMNKAELSFLTESSRKIKIIGRVIAIQSTIHPTGDFNEIKENELNKIPSIFHDVFLSSFGMLKSNDRILRPIALFFE